MVHDVFFKYPGTLIVYSLTLYHCVLKILLYLIQSTCLSEYNSLYVHVHVCLSVCLSKHFMIIMKRNFV